ncbi:hypothetical protein BASA60_002756 [Batrachochytrium salamandrivorans]|nr:hypothetical protein BASA60_002756 [Batrachochytrium salamandrivorans]
MQFFHLFSFVVAASYAAALPQPAGLSEKYSNNVDTNLVSILSARSYQPGLNSYKELATSTLIKRRGDSLESSEDDDYEGSSEDNSEGSVGDDYEGSSEDNSEGSVGDNSEGSSEDNSEGSVGDNSEGSSEENSGSDSSPPPATTPHKTFHTVFTKSDINSENLASTIDSVGDGMLEPAKDGKRAGKKIGGEAGRLLRRYMERNTYVNVALGRWKHNFAFGIFGVIKSGLGKEKYSKVEPDLTKNFKKIRASTDAEMDARTTGIWNILHESGSVIENVENIFKTATAPCYSTMSLLLTLKSQLSSHLVIHVYYTLKSTPINAICSGTDNDVFTLNVQGQLVRSQRWFWSRRTKQLYRNRYWLTSQVRPKTVKQRHSFALMETLRTCGDSASLQKYVTRQLLDTSGFFKDPSFDQSRAHGTRYLMLARMDALWTARKAIQIGILVDTHPFSVDHCILCDQQLLSTSIAHLVVECEQVTGHRIQSGLVPAIQKSRLRLLGRALDPGVENVYTWLRGGVINGEADLDQRWLDGTVEHESMGTRHDNRALAARLADFLQVAYRQYQSTLWKYHRDRLVEVG